MKAVPFLDRMLPDSLEALHRAGIRRNWPRRRCIHRVGDECAGIHLVVSGLVKVYRSNPAGREQIVLLEGTGSVLSLVPVIDQGEQIATAETLKPSTTMFVSSETFLEMFRQRNDVRDAVAMELARRLRLAFGLLETIALKPVVARVATRILELATVHEALDGMKHFRLLLSQDELAHVLATSRESVARALAELRTHGIIEQRGAQIRVVDARALFEWSNVTDQEATTTPLPALM